LIATMVHIACCPKKLLHCLVHLLKQVHSCAALHVHCLVHLLRQCTHATHAQRFMCKFHFRWSAAWDHPHVEERGLPASLSCGCSCLQLGIVHTRATTHTKHTAWDHPPEQALHARLHRMHSSSSGSSIHGMDDIDIAWLQSTSLDLSRSRLESMVQTEVHAGGV